MSLESFLSDSVVAAVLGSVSRNHKGLSWLGFRESPGAIIEHILVDLIWLSAWPTALSSRVSAIVGKCILVEEGSSSVGCVQVVRYNFLVGHCVPACPVAYSVGVLNLAFSCRCIGHNAVVFQGEV